MWSTCSPNYTRSELPSSPKIKFWPEIKSRKSIVIMLVTFIIKFLSSDFYSLTHFLYHILHKAAAVRHHMLHKAAAAVRHHILHKAAAAVRAENSWFLGKKMKRPSKIEMVVKIWKNHLVSAHQHRAELEYICSRLVLRISLIPLGWTQGQKLYWSLYLWFMVWKISEQNRCEFCEARQWPTVTFWISVCYLFLALKFIWHLEWPYCDISSGRPP